MSQVSGRDHEPNSSQIAASCCGPRSLSGSSALNVVEAALARIFGTGAGEARDDRARNGSQPEHPLHPFYAAQTKAARCWAAANYSVSRPAESVGKPPKTAISFL